MKPLIVIPTYNEKDNIVELIKVICMVDSSCDVLVVDDGSPDGTAELVEEYKKTNNRVFLLKRSGKQGLGTAYVAGFKWGLDKGYDYFVEMDADWSHPPRFLPEMLRNGMQYDFVVGSRYISGGGAVNWGLGRKIISRFGSLYSRIILGVPINDFTGGFNGWNAKVLNAIDLESIASDGYSFQIELKYKAAKKSFQFIEFPIIFEERREGQSKMSSDIVREAIWRVWQIRFFPPKKIALDSKKSLSS